MTKIEKENNIKPAKPYNKAKKRKIKNAQTELDMPEIKELEEEYLESHRPPFITEKVLKHLSDKKPEFESPRHRKERINAYKEY